MNGFLEWLETYSGALGLAATLGLLSVTAWYAHTTKRMSKTAAEAARHSAAATAAAERSAEAAVEAALVARSQVRVEFEGNKHGVWVDPPGEHVPSLEIRSRGHAVVVRSVRLLRAFAGEDGSPILSEEPVIEDVDLAPAPGSQLPVRLHSDTRFFVTHPELGKHNLKHFVLEVEYAFDFRESSSEKRRVTISAPVGP